MGLFAKPSMVALLNKEKATLDAVFGEGAYEISSDHRDQATLRSTNLEIGFGCARDGEIGALITLRDAPPDVSGTAGSWLWAKFLDADEPSLERDRNGIVRDPPEQQTKREIEIIARLVKEVFLDPRKLRDAAYFAEGYTRAYNDWSGGRW